LQDDIPYSRALLLKAGVYASFKEGLTFTGKEGKIKEKVYGIFSISLCKNISVINVFGGLHPTKLTRSAGRLRIPDHSGKVSYRQNFSDRLKEQRRKSFLYRF
jgi:hypothetical protein